MKTINVNNEFYNNIYIGTQAERLAIAHPFVYDRFIETDTNSQYVWGGTVWLLSSSDPTVLLYQRYGGVAQLNNAPIPVDTSLGGGAGLPFIKYVTAVGDGTGNPNLNGNYSGASTDFTFNIPLHAVYFVNTVTIQISSSNPFAQENYGGIPGGLVNGATFLFYFAIPGIYVPLLSGSVFHTNNDWFGATSHITLNSFSGQTNTYDVEFRLSDDFGCPLIMKQNDKFVVRLHDDFRQLTLHRYTLKGTLVQGILP